MDQLHQLVASLTQSEKRYFARLSLAHQSSGKYLKLFHHIVDSKKYNEKACRQKFGERHFAQLKQQLQHKILETLRAYHFKTLPQNQINAHIQNYRLLRNKELWNHADKELKQAHRKATTHDRYPEALSIFHEQTRLLARTTDKKAIQDHLNRWDQRVSEIVEQQSIELAYEKLYLEVTLLNDKLEGTRNAEEFQQVRNFLKSQLLRSQEQARTYQSKILRHFILGTAQYLIGDYDNSYTNMLQAGSILEENNGQLVNREDLYIRIMANQVLTNIRSGNYSNAEVHLMKFEKYAVTTKNLNRYKEYIVYLLRIMLLNTSLQYQKALEVIRENENWVTDHESNIIKQGVLPQEQFYSIFQRATALMGSGEYNQTKKIITTFLDKNKNHLKEEALFMIRIFYLIILLELDDEMLLKSELESLRRALVKVKRKFQFERTILAFVKGMEIKNTSSAVKMHYKRLADELSILKTVPFEKNVFFYFDFESWAKEKL